ncbi:HAD family hydrolase [Staphylothermus hellenicus]|uniref:Haloacid dehalogenase domain protein hydrolase n=1 Tax=Staphylothermus hellenicus (strain DSM 12710 / JCM 10830 / BK20S6-10-b1 / P8) TaxID=591019 RepID=D7DBD3_STAHD|nr:HAD family hydrolase [Staphylothermus hellenicus]ADI31480.1 Haloacid dehalogenase domain protein hydrolase [Staphylothermus hellenicus DSM 12710]
MVGEKLIIFDIDGVLIDSYSGIPIFYEKILPNMLGIDRDYSRFLLYMEYIYDQAGTLREEWWPKYFSINEETLTYLLARYWEIRTETSELEPGTRSVLKNLKSRGWIIGSVSYRDDIYGLKLWRIKNAGLHDLFEDIIVVGEDAPSRIEGIRILARKYKPKTIVYVDDKIQNLYRILGKLENIVLVWYRYSWINGVLEKHVSSSRIHVIHNMYELEKLLDEIS